VANYTMNILTFSAKLALKIVNGGVHFFDA